MALRESFLSAAQSEGGGGGCPDATIAGDEPFITCFFACAEAHPHKHILHRAVQLLPGRKEHLSKALIQLLQERQHAVLQPVCAALENSDYSQSTQEAIMEAIKIACRLGDTDSLLFLCGALPPQTRLPSSALGAALHNSHAATVQALLFGNTNQRVQLPLVHTDAAWGALRLPRHQPGAGGASNWPALQTCHVASRGSRAVRALHFEANLSSVLNSRPRLCPFAVAL